LLLLYFEGKRGPIRAISSPTFLLALLELDCQVAIAGLANPLVRHWYLFGAEPDPGQSCAMALTTPSTPFASRFRNTSQTASCARSAAIWELPKASQSDGLKGYQGHSQQSLSRYNLPPVCRDSLSLSDARSCSPASLPQRAKSLREFERWTLSLLAGRILSRHRAVA